MYCSLHGKFNNKTYCEPCEAFNLSIYTHKYLGRDKQLIVYDDSNNSEGATVKTKEAARSDAGKARLDLLSPVALEGTAAILAFGAKKYEANNWRKGMAWSRCIASLLRHLMAFVGGEDLDPESGLPHIDHVACNAMFLQQYFRTNKPQDDRYKNDKT